MKDEYGRITPDFQAWEKLGYCVGEIHENTYTLCNSDDPYDFINITAEYDTDCTDSGLPEYSKEHFEFPDSHLEDFTEAELNQIKLDIENYKLETKNNLTSRR